ncbi:MAG: hypothetical protein VYE73_13745 [Acidobacteriota bacterium]|nr:hypothetical protein [Acidobacteriota bacterium]
MSEEQEGITMSEEKPQRESHVEQTSEPELDRHSRSRRRLLRGMITATGATVAAGLVPPKWAKPIVNTALLPVHAQGSPLGTITGFWIIGDDAPGGADLGIPCGVTDNPNDYLYDDGTDMNVYGTLDPPAAVLVTLDVSNSGTNLGDLAFDADAATASADSGEFDFGSADPSNGDFGDDPGAGTVTLTMSAPGYQNCVITLNLSEP